MKHRYTDEQVAFIREQLPGKPHRELTELFNRRFGLSLSVEQVTAAAKNRKINNGLSGCFLKGHVPDNKGRKGWCAPGTEATRFKKGNRPQTYRPVGTESVTTDGYPVVKVADPNKWRLKHRMIWEAAYGPIPTKHCVMFADGNRQNCVLENLLLVSYRERAALNKLRLYGGSKELTESGLAIVRVKMAVTARIKGQQKAVHKGKE
jgi:hypothetical protein